MYTQSRTAGHWRKRRTRELNSCGSVILQGAHSYSLMRYNLLRHLESHHMCSAKERISIPEYPMIAMPQVCLTWNA